jgi:hypothetical protein
MFILRIELLKNLPTVSVAITQPGFKGMNFIPSKNGKIRIIVTVT